MERLVVKAGVGNDICLEIEDALNIGKLHVKHEADSSRKGLEEPDMRNRCGELDVAHALTAHLGGGDLHSALLADGALELHALVLTAEALIVLYRSENLRAEKSVALGLVSTVVDGLGLLYLAMRP